MKCTCTTEETTGETSVMCCNKCGKPVTDWHAPNRTPTEDDVKALGFELERTYGHDAWVTHRYKKESVSVEFTYGSDKSASFEVGINEDWRTCTLSQLKVIAEVWG